MDDALVLERLNRIVEFRKRTRLEGVVNDHREVLPFVNHLETPGNAGYDADRLFEFMRIKAERDADG